MMEWHGIGECVHIEIGQGGLGCRGSVAFSIFYTLLSPPRF